MDDARPPPQKLDADALFAQAQAGGEGAALAARRAAILAERRDPDLARSALELAARLDPLDPAPRLTLARLHAEAGDLEAARAEAGAVLAEAVDQAARARAAFILGEIARVLGERDAARAAFETVLAIEDALLKLARDDAAATRWYARARGRIAELDAEAGQRDRARLGAEGALSLLRAAASQIGEAPVLAADIADAEMRLAAIELDEAKPAAARRRLAEAIGRYEALAITETGEPHWRAVLADAWALAAEAEYARGADDAARAAMDKALQARLKLAAQREEEQWALAGTWRLRASLRAALGDHAEAAQSLIQARALAEKLAAHDAGAEAPHRFLVHTLIDQADHALRTEANALAREAAEAARTHAERFAAKPGAHAAWFADAAAAWDRLGECARAEAQPTLEAFANAVTLRRKGAKAAADDLLYTRGLSAALLKHGEAALASGDAEGAHALFAETVDLRLKLAEAAPGDANAALALAAALERAGLAAASMGDLSGARAAWEEELVLAEHVFADENDLAGLRFRAIVEAHLAGAGGPHAEDRRQAALKRFDILAQAGVLTADEAALRRKLWG